jgi:uncharacterized protein (DUF1684 family)
MWMLTLMLLFANDFRDAELEWRTDHEEQMKADDSWLNLVGLYWLQEGENIFGTSDLAHLVMPKHSTVNEAGIMYLENGQVRYKMSRAQRAVIYSEDNPEGKMQNEGVLEIGQVMAHNNLRMFLIERGGRLAIRARDLRSRGFLNFEKLEFYRPKKKYVVEAEFKPYETPDTMRISTVINTEIEMLVPGVLSFELDGQKVEVLPTLETAEDDKFFIMFKDQTSGSSTYAGGRFLYADRINEAGTVTLNFNRAFNPPCAYTDYATCPLPPAENWITVPVEAGERLYRRDYNE